MKKNNIISIAAVLLLSMTLLVLVAAILNTGLNRPRRVLAAATSLIAPQVTEMEPATALNDIDTSVTITGTGFTAVISGTLVTSSPSAYLGETALISVTWVTSATLEASVPWGLDPGVYTLTVRNPDGVTGILTNAFTVTQGIDSWNGGGLYGGYVRQILMKPGDPNTLYASAGGVNGIFRSVDAGEHWIYASDAVALGNGMYAIDPLHSEWLYGYSNQGLQRSQDMGDTWSTIMPNAWPDGRSVNARAVFASPYNPQVLFISSSEQYGNMYPNQAYGLIKSTDGGVSWHIVADMEGIKAQDLAFHPTDPQKMVLATSDMRVFLSSDGGDHWSEAAKPPMASFGLGGTIDYNPYLPSEVWIAGPSTAQGGSIRARTKVSPAGRT